MTGTRAAAGVRKALLLSTLVVVTLSVVGYALAGIVAELPIGQPGARHGNIFYVLYGRHERPHLVLLALFAVGTAIHFLKRDPPDREAPPDHRHSAAHLISSALAVVVIAWLGSHLVLHGLPVSMDEFNAIFQSKIFASGRFTAPVPQEWRALAPSITPIFVTYRPDDHVWLSGYLPVYAAIRAPFLAAGLDSLVNPLLSGLTVVALFAVARRLRPGDPWTPWTAIILLVTSSQFLVTSMTWYAMPAQLLANLGWLLLYLRGGRAWLMAPWVGVAAMGLNNPFPHGLFIAPFLLRLLRTGRRLDLTYAAVVYLAGAVLWLAWWSYALPEGSSGRMAGMFGFPDVGLLATQVMSLTLALSWQNLLLAPGIAVAVLGWRKLGTCERDLILGILLTLCFYAFFERTQGHGWGYRYFHPVLGSAVLVAAGGLWSVGRALGEERLRRAVGAAAAVALAVQLPARCFTIEGFVRPWSRAVALVAGAPEPVVVVPNDAVWYGADLIRNDPDLRPPVAVARTSIPREIHLPPEARLVTPGELGRLGLALRASEPGPEE